MIITDGFETIILKYICPGVGVILANAVFSSPVKSLSDALREGNLGDLNPTPWAFMTGNCIGWVAFSFLTSDIFVLSANAPGVVLSVWLNVGAAKLQYHEKYEAATSILLSNENSGLEDNILDSNLLGDDLQKDIILTNESRIIQHNLNSLTSHEIILLSIIATWILVLTTISFIPFSHEEKILIIGITVNINLVVFFGAPLSSIYTVITTKNSSSIHRPLMITNTFNAIFWLLYGLAIMNLFIIIPNFIGFVFGIIQILLSLWYPKYDVALDIDNAIMRTTHYDDNLKSSDASTVTSSSESYML